MLAVVKRLITGKGADAAVLRQQIAQLKTEGAGASAEVERLKRERALATSYDEATVIDDRIARQIWATEHCAAGHCQVEPFRPRRGATGSASCGGGCAAPLRSRI
jgi:hypothetical protein